MMIRVKVDEDLPESVARVFHGRGMDASTVREQGWAGMADSELWQRVQAEGRWLVTADKGFGDVRVHAPGTHCGVILFRLDHESRAAYLRLAEHLVDAVALSDLDGCIVVVTPAGVRIHRG